MFPTEARLNDCDKAICHHTALEYPQYYTEGGERMVRILRCSKIQKIINGELPDPQVQKTWKDAVPEPTGFIAKVKMFLCSHEKSCVRTSRERMEGLFLHDDTSFVTDIQCTKCLKQMVHRRTELT